MSETTPPAIGIIGLGRMGGAMADRLLAAGYPVSGTSRTRARAEGLIAKGLHWVDTPREVADSVDIVLTSLPDDDALKEVASGPNGLLTGLAQEMPWADTSTVSPRTSQGLAELVRRKGAWLLDAPVSGSVPQVQAGTLTIMIGGDENAYRRMEPILRELGTPTRVGPNGHGLVVKLAVNLGLAVQMLSFAEGLLLAGRAGVDRDVARTLMVNSAIGSPVLEGRAPLVFDLPDEAWFTVELMQKDVELALDLARTLDVPLPTAERADEVLQQARTFGLETRDIAALYEVLDRIRAQRSTAA